MRRRVIIFWLMGTLALVAVHLTLGRRWAAWDRIAAVMESGRQASAARQWDQAEAAYQDAVNLFPPDDRGSDAYIAATVKLEHARARNGNLPAAVKNLEELLQDSATAQQPATSLGVADLRREIADMNYSLAWLLRRAGAPATDWRPYVDNARRNLTALGEQPGPAREEAAANLERVALFEAASDQVIRQRRFPDPDLVASFERPGDPDAQPPSPGHSNGKMPDLGSGTANRRGGGPPQNPTKRGS